MKRLLTGFIILVFLFSCGNRKTKMDPFATITEMVDSAGHVGRYAATGGSEGGA